MTVNEYVKRWCDEDYDVRKEDFYVENAYYVADREWATSGFKHGLFAVLFAMVAFLFGSGDGIGAGILNAFVSMGILTICFWFYGIRNYDANCMVSSLFFYIVMAIFLFNVKKHIPGGIQTVFALLTFVLWVYFTFVKPIKFLKTKSKMKKNIEREEREEEESSKQSYKQWEHGYRAFRYGLPEADMKKDDPLMAEAKKLFVGYTDNKTMLKTRYRQLAKQYHPDKGGDTKLFQCIIAIYEEINKTLVS